MTTYVDAFTKPHQVQELAQYLDKLQYAGSPPKNSPRLSEYKALIDQKKQTDIIVKLLSESDLVFSKGSDGEVDAFWSLYCTLLTKLSSSFVQDLTPKTIDAIVKANEKPTLRLTVLAHMYNVFHEASWRYPIFTAILEYALKTGNSSAVDNLFETVDVRLKEWDSTPAQKRKIYDLVLKHWDGSDDGFDDEKFDVLIKYLSTFGDKDDLSSAKDRVKSLIIDLIKDPNSAKMDNILQFPVVSQLKNDSNYSKVHRLLEIFAKEGAPQYEQLYKQDPTYFTETLGLSHEDTLAKIRLLSLISLAATKDSITYAEAAQVTGIDKLEIDMLVVEGITRGIFDARLDQKNSTIIIRHAEPRIYDQQHWQRLDSRLTKWKANLTSVLDVVHTAKEQLATTTNTTKN